MFQFQKLDIILVQFLVQPLKPFYGPMGDICKYDKPHCKIYWFNTKSSVVKKIAPHSLITNNLEWLDWV